MDEAEQQRAGTLSVAVADDDLLLREGLASLLERHGFTVVGQAGDADGLLDVVEETEPDVVIVDIRMPPDHRVEGLEAAKQLRSSRPRLGIVVLSAHVEVEHAKELLAAGAATGYLLKSRITEVEDFVGAVRRVADGGSVIDPGVVQELVGMRRQRDPLAQLTPREIEVLALMAEGLSNVGIARRLFVAGGTVEKHVKSILSKLQLPESDEDHRRVLAVITFLEAR